MKFKFLISFTVFIFINHSVCENYLNNPCRELGVSPWKSFEEIKARYHELIKLYHPDKAKVKSEANTEKFRKIQLAFEQIKEERKDEEDFDSDEKFWLLVHQTIQIMCIALIILCIIYFGMWVTFKFFSYVWVHLIFQIFSFTIFEKFFPHYFESASTQYVCSLLVGFLLKYLSTKYLLCCKSKKTKYN